MVYLRDIEPADIAKLTKEMRRVDVQELRAAGVKDIYGAVAQSVTVKGPSWAAVDKDNNLIALFGFAEYRTLGRHAVPWLMGTDRLARHSKSLIKLSKTMCDTLMSSQYNTLSNYVWSENKPSIQYLKAIGFDIDKEGGAVLSSTGQTFYRFRRNNEVAEHV